MDSKDFGAIFGLAILLAANLVCAWILFFGGANWLENSPFAAAWPFRRFGFMLKYPEIPAGGFKFLAGAFWALEALLVVIAVLVSVFGH
jgi:hypothetical protein